MRRISAQRARAALPELVADARHHGRPTLITVYGQEAAVLVNPEWYRLRKTDADPDLPDDGLQRENGPE